MNGILYDIGMTDMNNGSQVLNLRKLGMRYNLKKDWGKSAEK